MRGFVSCRHRRMSVPILARYASRASALPATHRHLSHQGFIRPFARSGLTTWRWALVGCLVRAMGASRFAPFGDSPASPSHRRAVLRFPLAPTGSAVSPFDSLSSGGPFVRRAGRYSLGSCPSPRFEREPTGPRLFRLPIRDRIGGDLYGRHRPSLGAPRESTEESSAPPGTHPSA